MSDLDRFARRIEVRWRPVVAVLAGAVCLAAVLGIYIGDPDEVEQQATVTTTTTPPGIPGFGTISVRITAQGQTSDRCLLLAETPDQLSRGLMNRDDLGGLSGMIFRFERDSTDEFYMANVRIPLSIAWFDANGRFVSATEMEPCTVEQANCPRYRAAGPFRYAIETRPGDLDELGLGDGSQIQLVGACGFA